MILNGCDKIQVEKGEFILLGQDCDGLSIAYQCKSLSEALEWMVIRDLPVSITLVKLVNLNVEENF